MNVIIRSPVLKSVDQPWLYFKSKTVTKEKKRNVMDRLKFIPPGKHDYRNLKTNRRGGTSNIVDDEGNLYR